LSCTLSVTLVPWQPPSSTLFPYTTLFRSSHSSKVLVVAFSSVSPSISLHTVEFQNSGPGATRESRRIATGRRARSRRGAVRLSEDRKSTRLNSSHVSSSYAVFCLKKKNKK